MPAGSRGKGRGELSPRWIAALAVVGRAVLGAAKQGHLALALFRLLFVIKFSTAVTTNHSQATCNRQKQIRWCRAISFQHFPTENVIFQKCSHLDSDDTSVREIPKSEANRSSDGTVFLYLLSRGLKCQLKGFTNNSLDINAHQLRPAALLEALY